MAYTDSGVNANTALKDARAWQFWEVVCEKLGTSPLRTAEDVRDHPERQAHLLAVLRCTRSRCASPRTPLAIS